MKDHCKSGRNLANKQRAASDITLRYRGEVSVNYETIKTAVFLK